MKKLKVLLALTEPPSNSSGLGTLWAKLSIGISKHVELDFIAPHLETCFATKDNQIGYCGTLIEIKDPPLNRKASVKINDPSVTGLTKLFWTAIRAFTKVGEKVKFNEANDYSNWVVRRIQEELMNPEKASHYDYLAVHVPSLNLAETVYSTSKQIGKPLILVIGDPQGWRNGAEFVPHEPSLQQKMLSDCAALIITQATYHNYYEKHFDIDTDKVIFFSDSYMPHPSLPAAPDFGIDSSDEKRQIELLHWGAIADYRDPSALIDAIGMTNTSSNKKLRLTVAGPIFSKFQKRYATRVLGDSLKIDIPPCYSYAKQMISAADIYVVIVSNRHMDNVPSKLVEGLSFKRPMLVLANSESATAEFVKRNQIGIVISTNSANEIVTAIDQLLENYDNYVAAFDTQEIESFDVKKVGGNLGEQLIKVLS